MPILDDVRSGRPILVTACTGVNELKQTCKTQKQKQQYKFLLQKLQQLHGYIRYRICVTMSSIYSSIYCFSVMIWSLCWTLCFKNSIDVRKWILLVSPGKSLLSHPSSKFPQFISPLSLQPSPNSRIDHGKFDPGLLKKWLGLHKNFLRQQHCMCN